MNAIKNNPFLTALVVVTVIIAGVLLFLISSASTKLNETVAAYESKQTEYDALTRAKTYPSEENLQKLKNLRRQYAERVAELRKELSQRQIEPQNLTTRGFQDLLIQQIEEAEALAQENGVELPGDFGFGMSQYRSVLPPEKAVPELTVQLEVIDAVITRMIQAPVSSINSIQRLTLPEEQGLTRNPDVEEPERRRGRRGGRDDRRRGRDRQDEDVKILDRETFLVDFTASGQNTHAVFNSMYDIQQLVTMQLVSLRNEETTGPSKNQAGPQGPPRRVLIQDPDDPDAPLDEEEALEPAAQFILGDEQVEGTIRFQIVSPTPQAVAKLEELL